MKTHPLSKQSCGMTILEIIVVIVVVMMLMMVFLPSLANRNTRAPRISCVNQLKQIGLGFRIWQDDNNDKFPMSVSVTNGGTMDLVESGTVWRHFQVMSNELNTPKILFCPSDSAREKFEARIWNATHSSRDVPFTNDLNSSYFIGVDAEGTKPQMFLAGDRNLAVKNASLKPGLHSLSTNAPVSWTKEIHVNQGNVLMADASVQQFTTSALQMALKNTGSATNRLALP